MRAECIAAVTQAALKMGRELKPGDFDKIEQRIRQARQDIAVERGDEYANLPPSEQIRLGAKRVADDIVAQTRRRAANASRSVQAKINAERFIEQQSAKGEHRVEAINRINVTDQDLGANVSSLEQERRGIYAEAMRHLQDAYDATRQFAGFWTNKQSVRDLVDEIMGKDTGNLYAKTAAEKWLKATESLRAQYNEFGGNIRKLAYGYLPQKWSQAKLANTLADDFATDIVPRLNRRFYRNEDGRPMTEAELTDMVKAIHFNATTDNSFVGKGGDSVVERHQDRRVLHFKSGQDWMDVQAKYGVGSVLEAMSAHVNTMSKEIAALKVWGPTPDATFNQVLKGAAKKELEADPRTADTIQAKATVARSMYEAAIGRMGPIGNPKVFRAFQVMRSINLFRLGSSAVSALSDGSNVTAVAHSWSIPYVRRYLYGLKAWLSSDFRHGLNSQGIGVETFAHLFARFGEENMGHGATATFAQQMLRLFLVNHIDNVRRTASGAMLMNDIERMAGKYDTLESIHPQDGMVMRHRGVTPENWQVWKAAGEDLSPDKIANIPDAAIRHLGNPDQLRRDAAQKLLGVALSDVDTVVPLMTAKTLGKLEAHGWASKYGRGTIGGELIRSFLTFKSFPISNFNNHFDRMMSYGTMGGKALYAAQIIATSTVMGAISVQLKAMANGENPQDMTDWKFAGRALVQGGAMGLYFDILAGALVNLHGDRPKDAASAIADQMGPTIGTAKDIMSLMALPTKDQAMADYGANEGEKAVSAVRRLAPMPFYAKAAVDRLIFQQLQDMFSPGFAERAQERTQKQYNNGYYWPPSSYGRVEPPEVPNFNTAVGRR